MLTFTLERYGWVALALPVCANVSWDPERPLNKPAHTLAEPVPPSRSKPCRSAIDLPPEATVAWLSRLAVVVILLGFKGRFGGRPCHKISTIVRGPSAFAFRGGRGAR